MARNNEQHTVIIPSYNTLEHLKNTYKSLLLYGNNIDIILIDDASTDGTADWFKTLKGVSDAKEN